MKYILLLIFTFFVSTTHARMDFTGIWKDNQGGIYSIHESNNSIIMGEIYDNQFFISPVEQGAIHFTNNELDLAINGYGFFILESDDGTYTYTRNGKFKLSSDNLIVNDRGERLLTKNMKNIPYTTDGMEIKTEKEEVIALECNTFFGCPSVIEETRQIIIGDNGSISLHNSKTGEIFEFDRIQLASINFEHIKFSGYPISLKNQHTASFFYPQDKPNNVFIQQGGLEKLSYNMQIINGYSGDIVDNKARLTLISDPNSDNSITKEINFFSNSTAVIKSECLSDKRICDAFDDLQDKQIIKVY